MNDQQTHLKIESPCVRNCCLDHQDICLGCFRTITEITTWQQSSVSDKKAILARATQRKLARNKPD